MKGLAIKKYTCPNCSDGVKLLKPDTYVRCRCGTLAMFGNPEDPAVVCAVVTSKLEVSTVIVPAPDDYKYRSVNKGGVVFANPKRGKMVGMTPAQMDLIMPLLAFAKIMTWDSRKLMQALDAFAEYDELIKQDL